MGKPRCRQLKPGSATAAPPATFRFPRPIFIPLPKHFGVLSSFINPLHQHQSALLPPALATLASCCRWNQGGGGRLWVRRSCASEVLSEQAHAPQASNSPCSVHVHAGEVPASSTSSPGITTSSSAASAVKEPLKRGCSYLQAGWNPLRETQIPRMPAGSCQPCAHLLMPPGLQHAERGWEQGGKGPQSPQLLTQPRAGNIPSTQLANSRCGTVPEPVTSVSVHCSLQLLLLLPQPHTSSPRAFDSASAKELPA